MSRIKIRRFMVKINTSQDEYGFKCEFKSGLNIIRGNNSSGKSTLVNSIIYVFGMEELLGGKGPKMLPYALKDYIENDKKSKIKVESSYVYIEVANNEGEIVTLKRAAKSSEKDTKLIEIIKGEYLSNPKKTYEVIPTFLHDKGSAQYEEAGFFSFLEKFIGLALPNVFGANGGEVKLYLQTIFSAIFVEQKRGWTDYIANTPYYAIRDVRTKIVEFLLDLDIFDNDRARAQLTFDLNKIQSEWSENRMKIRLIEETHSIKVSGIKTSADENFDPNLTWVTKVTNDSKLKLDEHILELTRKLESIENAENKNKDNTSVELINLYHNSEVQLNQLIDKLDAANTETRLARTRLSDYLSSKLEIEKDLEKNKIAKKLKSFGAEQNLKISHNNCPTCHQHIDDSLLLPDTLIQPMTIEENINYLESQRKMVSRYIAGINDTLANLESQSNELSELVADQRSVTLSLKKQIRVSGSASETDIRIKLQLENKIERLVQAEREINTLLSDLEEISKKYKSKKAEMSDLPNREASQKDQIKKSFLQDRFREHASLFGYKSAPPSDIEINKDTLFPYLSGLELREINTDIKSDSSASDFVRLIWAYLISIFSTSKNMKGNHIGLLVLDEPAQHSMAVKSVNSLLKKISTLPKLQSIVAASFDESDKVFEESVANVEYHLISCGSKLLQPVSL